MPLKSTIRHWGYIFDSRETTRHSVDLNAVFRGVSITPSDAFDALTDTRIDPSCPDGALTEIPAKPSFLDGLTPGIRQKSGPGG